MTDIITNIIEPKKENVKIIYKRPEYLNVALRKHYNKKKEEDPAFLEKERERNRKYREANREHVNELARIRRRNKKLEAQNTKVVATDKSIEANIDEKLKIDKLQL